MKKLFLLLCLLLANLASASDRALTAEENRSMLIAAQRYPDLKRENTPHYKAYQTLLNQSIAAKSAVFKNPKWPLLIAEKSRETLPTLQRGAQKVGRTKIEKYEDAIKEMLASDDPTVRQYGQLEQAAHQAELAGETEKAAMLRAQLAELQALGRIESLLNEVNNDIWKIKMELGIP